MARDLNSSTAAQLSAPIVYLALLVMITFRTSVQYCWTGSGTLSYGGNLYLGVGSLGKIGSISEGLSVEAQGTSVTLSGIDPVLLAESMTDIKSGGAATVSLALMTAGMTIIGVPYQLFAGTVDVPTVDVGGETIAITLTLENQLVNLGRATQTRYTSADQAVNYPDDSGFNWVETLNDIALRWGM